MSVELAGHGLSFVRDGREVLRDVGLSVHGGECVALTGPSGSGKTTLLGLLAGLQQPDAGRVLLNGQPLAEYGGALRRRIGVVFQGYALVALLTAAENIELALKAAGFSPDEAAGRAEEALETVGLAERAEHLVEELSGGQQQRIALARALADRPDVLLADEPAAEQDPAHRVLALEALLGAAEAGTAVVLATHSADDAGRCDRTLRLADGRLIGEDAG